MKLSTIKINPEKRYQIFTLSVDPDGNAFRARVELRYINANRRWYITIIIASTGECLCRYGPLIASYYGNALNDLLAPFSHKHIGSMYCIPKIASPSSENPGLNNLGEFEIVWGDTDDR